MAHCDTLIMFLRSFRRSSRLGNSRINIKAIAILTFALCLFDLIFLTWNRLSASAKPYHLDHPEEDVQKIYIASIHWNNEEMIRSNWTDAVLDLVSTFGPENVYVSVYESGSWDDSKGALRELDEELERIGVQRTITLDPRTHVEEIAQTPASTGWIDTPRGKKELRRIPYLSRLRNLSMKPLTDLALNGIIFDRILFLNDVVFTVWASPNGKYSDKLYIHVLMIHVVGRLRMCKNFSQRGMGTMQLRVLWILPNHRPTMILLPYEIPPATRPWCPHSLISVQAHQEMR